MTANRARLIAIFRKRELVYFWLFSWWLCCFCRGASCAPSHPEKPLWSRKWKSSLELMGRFWCLMIMFLFSLFPSINFKLPVKWRKHFISHLVNCWKRVFFLFSKCQRWKLNIKSSPRNPWTYNWKSSYDFILEFISTRVWVFQSRDNEY